ncbi:hypothetical protein C1645_741909 [Glomus cerebriforme]|uniref:Uncharacterized protein n=1 Tax=Glomus cerebriforme TaxID=658196 RepID=A0A397SG52_9GLOM|nr:hypothetical protein C1645_741909 [Glomus cerebriforme]
MGYFYYMVPLGPIPSRALLYITTGSLLEKLLCLAPIILYLFSFSTERQKQGKRSDVMFMEGSEEKLYEVESSRIVFTRIKKENDNVKLWREMNDGMALIHKGCKPDKNEFGVLGLHIVGKIMHLNILNTDDIHRLFHLRSVEIPIQPADGDDVLQLVEALLLLRNIIIVNIYLLLNAPEARSERLKRSIF